MSEELIVDESCFKQPTFIELQYDSLRITNPSEIQVDGEALIEHLSQMKRIDNIEELIIDCNSSLAVGQHIHLYNNKDQVQINGGSAWLLGSTFTREFKGAENVRAKDAEKPGVLSPDGGPMDSHSSMHSNIDIWKKYIQPILK